MQDVVALHAAEAAEHVGADVPEWMTYVEPRTRGVREHVEHEQLGATGKARRVGERTGGVRCLKGALGLPPILPTQFDFLGERGGVTERLTVVGPVLGGGIGVHSVKSRYKPPVVTADYGSRAP